MAEEVHVGDIGLQFRITISDSGTVVDLSSATTKQMIFLKPDGSRLVKDADLYTDGTDGIITYNTTSGDIDVIGRWLLQCYIVIGTNQWHTAKTSFQVYRNI